MFSGQAQTPYTALDAYVLPENDHSAVGGQQLVERGIDRLGQYGGDMGSSLGRVLRSSLTLAATGLDGVGRAAP